MSVFLRAYEPYLESSVRGIRFLGIMPDLAEPESLVERNNIGFLKFRYKRDGVNAALLSKDVVYLTVVADGIEERQVFMLDEDADEEGNFIAVGCPGIGCLLDLIIVYPDEWIQTYPKFDEETPETFDFDVKTSAGEIMNTLLGRVQERALNGASRGGPDPSADITLDFDIETDSAGNAWKVLETREIDVGSTLLQVLTDLSDDGWCDWRFDGFRLQMFNRGSPWINADRPDVILRKSREIGSVSRRRQRLAVRTTMLALAEDGLATEITQSQSFTRRFGRRETVEKFSGIRRRDSIAAVANATLDVLAFMPESQTLTYPWAAGQGQQRGAPVPLPGRSLVRTNYAPRPTMDVVLPSYGQNSSLSLETTDGYVGPSSVRVSALSGNNGVDLPWGIASPFSKVPPPNSYLSVSARVKVLEQEAQVYLGINTRSSTGALLMEQTGNTILITPGDGWVRVTLTGSTPVPFTTTKASFAVHARRTKSLTEQPNAKPFLVDAVFAEIREAAEGPGVYGGFFQNTDVSGPYEVGQYVRYDQARTDETRLTPMMVHSIASTWDTSGNRLVSVELQTPAVRAVERLNREIKRLKAGGLPLNFVHRLRRLGFTVSPPTDPSKSSWEAGHLRSLGLDGGDNRHPHP